MSFVQHAFFLKRQHSKFPVSCHFGLWCSAERESVMILFPKLQYLSCHVVFLERIQQFTLPCKTASTSKENFINIDLLLVHVSWEEFISTLNVSELPFAIRVSPTSCSLDVLFLTLAYCHWKVLPTVCKYPPAQALPSLLVTILIDQQDNLASIASFWSRVKHQTR